jgi:uncharacterized membrane protein YeaQ/YmgE (transglycosylase-associated protein family)
MILWIMLIAVGLIAGSVVSSLTGGGGFGDKASLGVGLAGSLLGGILAEVFRDRLIDPHAPIFLVALIAGAVGAILLLVVVNLIKKFK